MNSPNTRKLIFRKGEFIVPRKVEAPQPPRVHERLTVPEFAKRVHRNRQTVYGWIRTHQMPAGSVVKVHGHLEIDWTVYEEQSIQAVN
jgi:hypothetical protein